MASGIKGSCNRPKSGKNLKGAAKEKRYRNESESQKKYHEAIALRRAKAKKRK